MEMIVRRYQDSDYDHVFELVVKMMPRSMPKKLGGCGVVIEEDSQIVGFIWAFVDSESSCSCVDLFCVREDKQNEKIYGPLLFTRMLVELKKMGIQETLGFFCNFMPYTESLVRIGASLGAGLNEGWVLSGNVENILEKANEVYYGRLTNN